MSLILAAAVGFVAVSAGSFVAVRLRRAAKRRSETSPGALAKASAPGGVLTGKEGERARPFGTRGFGVELGDVIEVRSQELWIESAWLLTEAEDPVFALMFSRDAILLVHPGEPLRLSLLSCIELDLPDPPPSALDVEGTRFERVRRLPVKVTAFGGTAAPPFDEAVVTEFRGLAGDVLYVLGHHGFCRVWQGRTVDAADVTLWGGGQSTLE